MLAHMNAKRMHSIAIRQYLDIDGEPTAVFITWGTLQHIFESHMGSPSRTKGVFRLKWTTVSDMWRGMRTTLAETSVKGSYYGQPRLWFYLDTKADVGEDYRKPVQRLFLAAVRSSRVSNSLEVVAFFPVS